MRMHLKEAIESNLSIFFTNLDFAVNSDGLNQWSELIFILFQQYKSYQSSFTERAQMVFRMANKLNIMN